MAIRMNFIYPLIFSIIFIGFITGCGGNEPVQQIVEVTDTPPPIQVSTSLPTEPPTETPKPIIPTESPTAIPSPTLHPTVTPVPTESPLPPPSTATPLPSPTATPMPPTLQSAQAEATVIPPTSQPAPAEVVSVSSRTVRVGLNGRNDIGLHESDYRMIQEAKIETLKMMSVTEPQVFARIQEQNPDIEFIVRLYDDRMNENGHPTPEEYVQKISPIMTALKPYVTKFEVGNEPNHYLGYEGWGPTDAEAQNFNEWFIKTYDLLKVEHPWAELGYPALGTPDSVHRDKSWLKLNEQAIKRADWLGVHCYWQTNPDGTNTMFDEDHGLCFKYYHEKFPDKPIELTEFDNDNIYYDLPLISEEQMAKENVAYYQELFKYPYIRSASGFIMSSPEGSGLWDSFVWRNEDGSFKPIVAAVSNMERPPLITK